MAGPGAGGASGILTGTRTVLADAPLATNRIGAPQRVLPKTSPRNVGHSQDVPAHS